MLLRIFFLIIFFGCTFPYKIFKINPINEKSFWLYGKEFATNKINNKIVNIAFDDNNYKRMKFLVSILNNDTINFIINPKKFKMICPTRCNYDSTSPNIVYANDPEKEVIQIKKKISRNTANEFNHNLFTLSTSTINVVEDISDVTHNLSAKEREEKNKRREEQKRYNKETELSLENRKRSLLFEFNRIQSTLLRKTTLFPNSSVHGIIEITPYKLKNQFQIFVPLGKDSLIFKFQKTNE